MRASCAGLTKLNSRQTATDSTASARSSARAARQAASSSGVRTSPRWSRRSGTPLRRRRGTIAWGGLSRGSKTLSIVGPAKLDLVAEARGGDEPHPGPLVLQQCVGRDRRAVHDEPRRREKAGEVGAPALGDLGDGGHDAVGLIRRRRHLGRLDRAGVAKGDDVGERAADVDPDAPSGSRFRHDRLPSVTPASSSLQSPQHHSASLKPELQTIVMVVQRLVQGREIRHCTRTWRVPVPSRPRDRDGTARNGRARGDRAEGREEGGLADERIGVSFSFRRRRKDIDPAIAPATRWCGRIAR